MSPEIATSVAPKDTPAHTYPELPSNRAKLFGVIAVALLVLGGGVTWAVLGSKKDGADKAPTKAEVVATGTRAKAPEPQKAPPEQKTPPAAAGESQGAAAAAGKAPDVAQAKPKKVRLTFVSEPRGARVMIGDKVVATTNGVHEIPYSETALLVKIEKDGYEPGRKAITPSKDQEIRVELRRKERRRRAHRVARRKRSRKPAARAAPKPTPAKPAKPKPKKRKSEFKSSPELIDPFDK